MSYNSDSPANSVAEEIRENFRALKEDKIVAADSATTAESCTGNAATATKLETAVNINGVSFDGSADITITAEADGGNADTLNGKSVDDIESASKFTGWQEVSTSGTAATDGILIATSGFNLELVGYTSGIKRFSISPRDKYGTGYNATSMPVMKGESWSFTGASTVWFMGIGS
ncbi:MAG: hypothetical protein H6Q69_1820 [Firmicutes bacterium]|nr:hypothetical protein [Bacillota bacterium]